MKSFEGEIKDNIDVEGQMQRPKKLNLWQSLWLSIPFSRSSGQNIYSVLGRVHFLECLGHSDLLNLMKYLHIRTFNQGEIIFAPTDKGVALYFVASGSVEISSSRNRKGKNAQGDAQVTLGKYSFFGENALLNKGASRNAQAKALSPAVVYAIFRPDLEEMMKYHPSTAALFIMSLSSFVVRKFEYLENELIDII